MIAQLNRDYISAAGLVGTFRRLLSYVMFEGRPATTRGQWFNPAVAANLQLGMWFGGRPLDRPIFIVGVGRSGTTHLGRILSVHREVAWLNEPKLLWSRAIVDEDVSGFYNRAGRFHVTPDETTVEMRQKATRMLGYYLSMTGATRLVDKYPEMTYRIPFLRTTFPDAKIIAIVRRPEDFVNSVVDWNATHARGDEDWWGRDRRKWKLLLDELVRRDGVLSVVHDSLSLDPTEQEMAAAEWVVGMRELVTHQSQVDLVVSYEQLAQDPLTTICTVMDHCELAPQPQVKRLAQRSTVSELRSARADLGVMSAYVEETRIAIGDLVWKS